MFKKAIRKGFSLVELIIVMLVVGILSAYVFSKITDTDDAKITALAQTMQAYSKTISMYNATPKAYFDLKTKINAISDGDEDMLDEMEQIGIIGSFPRSKFKEPNNTKIEIREVIFDGYRKYIYLYIDSTNNFDKYIINEAIKKNSPKDDDVEYIN